MSLLKEKKELFDNILKSDDWVKFAKTIRTNHYISRVYNFMTVLSNRTQKNIIILHQDIRKFITSYTMIKFDMFDKNSTKDVNLYYIVLDLHKSFDLIFINKLETSFIETFLDKYINFLIAFKKWKEYDEKKLLDKTCTQQYKQIQVMEKQFTGDTPDEKQLSASSSMLKMKIEKRIKQIGGKKALDYVNNSPTLHPVDTLSLDMEENMKKAFWDKFEEEVDKKNLDPICENLDEFRKYLFELLGDSKKAKEVKEEFDSGFDLELVKQMIKNSAMDAYGILSVMKLLTGYVQKYIQSHSEDEDTKMILDNAEKMIMESRQSLGKILRYYFQNMFQKFDKTKVQMRLLGITK